MQKNQKTIDWLLNWTRNKWPDWIVTEDNLYEILIESGKVVHVELIESRRWWDDMLEIRKFDDKFIGFHNAYTTGDKTPEETGWEFDPKTVQEYESYQETVTLTKYRLK